ncbi:MAG: tripartite tricarboxylate transporter substrate binding protein [Burkholderiaceae bacterium]|nr:tripartite tricarboxylate transporter substrate binding protein [Burkholderiaceae bacterium]
MNADGIVWARRAMIAGLAGLCFAAGSVLAQQYPDKPVRLVVPYPPATLPDSFARAFSDELGKQLGQPVVIDNKPGGSLIIGTDAAAKAAPDGYTLLLASVSGLALNVGAFKKLPYDPVKDFKAISLVFSTPLYLLVSATLPIQSVKDFVAYAKAHPGAMSYASVGHGSSLHLMGAAFARSAGIELQHVPYKGSAAAMSDLTTGRVSAIFDGGALLPQVTSGKLRVLAVTGSQRLPSYPDLPTMTESGVPGLDADFWFGIVAPAATPDPVVARLSKAIRDVVASPALASRLGALPNVRTGSSSPDEFSNLIKRDIPRWNGLLKNAGVVPQD